MISIILLWLFMPLILVLLTIGFAWFGLRWLLRKLDASLLEDDDSNNTPP